MEEDDDRENLFDFGVVIAVVAVVLVVEVMVVEMDDMDSEPEGLEGLAAECVIRGGFVGGGDGSFMFSPATSNLLTCCAPSLIPSNTAPLP